MDAGTGSRVLTVWETVPGRGDGGCGDPNWRGGVEVQVISWKWERIK